MNKKKNYRYYLILAALLGLLLVTKTQTVSAGSLMLDEDHQLVDGGQLYEEFDLPEIYPEYPTTLLADIEVPPRGRIIESGISLPEIRIMPLGNSITKGTGTCSPGPNEYLDCIGYREDLWNALVNNGYPVNFVGSQGAAFQYQYTYDNDHEGLGGFTASQIKNNIYGSGENWLQNYPAEIILLHIGTNDIGGIIPTEIPGLVQEVNQILNKIDQYESDQGKEVYVILARIINRIDPDGDEEAYTSMFNQQLQTMADIRIAGGDKLMVVDMEAALGFPTDYSDNLHPNATGYSKMANIWYTALEQLINLPPIFTYPGDQYSVQDQTVSLQVLATDPENDTLAFSAGGLPPGLTIDPFTGEIHGKISNSVISGTQYTVTVTADDQTPFPDTVPYNQDQVTFTWKISEKVVLPIVIR